MIWHLEEIYLGNKIPPKTFPYLFISKTGLKDISRQNRKKNPKEIGVKSYR